MKSTVHQTHRPDFDVELGSKSGVDESGGLNFDAEIRLKSDRSLFLDPKFTQNQRRNSVDHFFSIHSSLKIDVEIYSIFSQNTGKLQSKYVRILLNQMLKMERFNL